MRNQYGSFVAAVRARLERAKTPDEVLELAAAVTDFRINLLKKGQEDSVAGDEARTAARLCNERLTELLKEELNKLFD